MSSAGSVAQPGKTRAKLLIRHPETDYPLFDDYHNIPEEFHHLFDQRDWDFINLQRSRNPKDGDNAS